MAACLRVAMHDNMKFLKLPADMGNSDLITLMSISS